MSHTLIANPDSDRAVNDVEHVGWQTKSYIARGEDEALNGEGGIEGNRQVFGRLPFLFQASKADATFRSASAL
jgi:hypothetical protein